MPRRSLYGRVVLAKCNDGMLDSKFAAIGVLLFGDDGVAPNLG